jgi:Response regulator containing a CheY-like receiver domain and an HTH DNA-binding domain
MLIRIALLILISLFSQTTFAQSGLHGQILLDTSIWRPVVYLSLITDLDKMYTMSNDMIIDQVTISGSGKFSFDTKYFPEEDNLFRIHFSKKNDPPATLNIGGNDENHIFLIASKHSNITLKNYSENDYIKNITVIGYYPNSIIKQIDEITGYADSTTLTSSTVKNDLIKSAVFEKLRIIADTCSNPLVSLYAVYKGDFEKNYPVNQQFYKNFLSKWRKENSSYFKNFKNKIPAKDSLSSQYIIPCLFSLIAGFLICLLVKFRKPNKRIFIQDLSLQERKIYGLLLEGKSNKEIADLLVIELSTVKSHISSIYTKLNISSRKDILNLNLEKQDS